MKFKNFETVKNDRTKFLAALNPWSFDFQIATWFGTGLIIPASGTWGTLGGMIVALPLLFLTNSISILLMAAFLFALGFVCVSNIEKKLADHDPSFIVIDEVAAIFLLIGLISLSPQYLAGGEYLIGFALFRFFDARKPWIIGVADRKLKGAMGVMVDDILAAIFAYIGCYAFFMVRIFCSYS